MVLSPTDLVGHVACAHLTQLELRAARGEPRPARARRPRARHRPPQGPRPRGAPPRRRRRPVARVVRIEPEAVDRGAAAAAAATVAAMAAGVDVVYQATFFDGAWRGHADFLERVEVPSRLGAVVLRAGRHQAQPAA